VADVEWTWWRILVLVGPFALCFASVAIDKLLWKFIWNVLSEKRREKREQAEGQ
jgi:hypothetical protein